MTDHQNTVETPSERHRRLTARMNEANPERCPKCGMRHSKIGERPLVLNAPGSGNSFAWEAAPADGNPRLYTFEPLGCLRLYLRLSVDF